MSGKTLNSYRTDRPSDSSNDVTSSREWPWWVNSPAAGPKREREAKSRGIFSFNQPPNYLGRWKYLCVCKQANSYNCCCCKTSRGALLHGSGKLDKALGSLDALDDWKKSWTHSSRGFHFGMFTFRVRNWGRGAHRRKYKYLSSEMIS